MTELATYRHSSAGFSIPVPAGWETSEEVEGAALVAVEPDRGGVFRSNVVVTGGTRSTGLALADWAERCVGLLSEELDHCRPARVRSRLMRKCIPHWYRSGMSTQVAVRLPDELVAFLDDLVARGHAPSRAAAVTHALERERRRATAARDAAILAQAGDDSDDLDRLASFATHTPMDDLG